MAKLRIKRFGPIEEGFQEGDGYLTISPVTVFIGPQASGKSTVAKLYSTFTWLEKAFVKQTFDAFNFKTEDFLFLCSNHGLCSGNKSDMYFRSNTEIEYKGGAFNFSYIDSKFSIMQVMPQERHFQHYRRPKIIYVPAERNLLSVLQKAENIAQLPQMLSVFQDRYEKAKKNLGSTVFDLPVDGISFRYNKANATAYIVSAESMEIPISAASSGLQSLAPLALVSDFLFSGISDDLVQNLRTLSYNERENIKQILIDACSNKDYARILERKFDNVFLSGTVGIEPGIVIFMKEQLKYYFNTCFINIVEEPEQNLFPSSQKGVLFNLLRYVNANDANELFITTHSPYIIAYLTLAIKAFELGKLGGSVERIARIVPPDSFVDGKVCTVYEINSGVIKKLKTYGSGMPSDNNELNNFLTKTNDQFDELLEIQEDAGL